MTTDPSMKDALEKVLPKSLDDLITINRELASLRIATDEDINNLKSKIPVQEPVAVITRWCLISLDIPKTEDGRTVLVCLTGYNTTHKSSWMTSPITGIDLDAGLVTTHSGSLYRLEGARIDDPDLPYICATLHRWGIGDALGVPSIYFERTT